MDIYSGYYLINYFSRGANIFPAFYAISCYYKGERGNKPYPLETMLRLYLLQNLYDLSDEATAAEAIDSRAFSDFCGVDSSNQVPNGDTIAAFGTCW